MVTAQLQRFGNHHVFNTFKLWLPGKRRQGWGFFLIRQQYLIIPLSPCLIKRRHTAVLFQLIHDLVDKIFYIPFQITVDLFPFGILKPSGKLFHPIFNLRINHGTGAQGIHQLPHRIRRSGFQFSASLILLFINIREVLPENIMSQLRTHGLNGFLREITVIIFGRVNHQMYMRMMPLIMKRRIPPQVLAADLHVPAKHGPFGTQQRHPLLCTVITESCRIFSPQGYHMSPDCSLVIGDLFLYL